ncbi:glycosyltransferase family 39 protein [Candidatus Dependentiae bacterium]|nr:glycosyltransferase family 39 protein [Candidatus Dependentiae bacterium]
MKLKFLVIIPYIIFTVILLYTVKNPNRLELDSYVYERIAENFLENNILKDPQTEVMPTISVGYPLFLGLIYKIFGHNFLSVVFIQAFLGLLIIFLIFKIAQILFDTQIALTAAFLSSINLGLITYTQFLLTEILLVSILLSFFYFFLKYLNSKNIIDLFFASTFIGISLIIKPVAIFYISIPLTIFLFQKSLLQKVFIFFVPIILICSTLVFYNYKTYNSIVLTLAGHENIFRYFLPRVISADKKINLEQAQKIVDSNIATSSNKKYSELYSLLLEYILKKPFLCIKIWIFNVLKTCFGLHYTAFKVLLNNNIKGGSCAFFNMEGNYLNKAVNYIFYGCETKFLAIFALCEILLVFLQYLGLLFLFCAFYLQKKFLNIFLIASYIVYFALITGHDGFGRYRILFEPLLIICAAYLLCFAFNRLRQRKMYERFA